MQARTCSQLFSRALALNYAAMLQQFRGARQLVLEHAEQARILCAEQGFAYYQAWATFMQGCAVGQSEKGVEQMREGLDALLGTGAGLRQPYYLALMAQVCGASGASEEALDLLSRGQEIVEQTQERMWEAELPRVRGELLLMSGREHQVEAESCFFAALDVARGQEARSLELRAALSLAQLWKKQGSRDGARELLAEVYEWFTEGFDTADLKAARTLLDELEE